MISFPAQDLEVTIHHPQAHFQTPHQSWWGLLRAGSPSLPSPAFCVANLHLPAFTCQGTTWILQILELFSFFRPPHVVHRISSFPKVGIALHNLNTSFHPRLSAPMVLNIVDYFLNISVPHWVHAQWIDPVTWHMIVQWKDDKCLFFRLYF